jgi:hypothetical protein
MWGMGGKNDMQMIDHMKHKEKNDEKKSDHPTTPTPNAHRKRQKKLMRSKHPRKITGRIYAKHDFPVVAAGRGLVSAGGTTCVCAPLIPPILPIMLNNCYIAAGPILNMPPEGGRFTPGSGL